MTDFHEEYVSVPKSLLARVLRVAENDSFACEVEFACDKGDHDNFRREREDIKVLRTAAGIEES